MADDTTEQQPHRREVKTAEVPDHKLRLENAMPISSRMSAVSISAVTLPLPPPPDKQVCVDTSVVPN